MFFFLFWTETVPEKLLFPLDKKTDQFAILMSKNENENFFYVN